MLFFGIGHLGASGPYIYKRLRQAGDEENFSSSKREFSPR